MCGELEDEAGPNELESSLYNAFLVHARALLAQSERAQKRQRDPLIEKIDKLFSDALSRAVRDGENSDADERYQVMAMQPLVFARLAGFMAAHCSLHEDPLRKVMEALMHGYAEADRITPDHGHDHDGAQGHFGHQH